MEKGNASGVTHGAAQNRRQCSSSLLAPGSSYITVGRLMGCPCSCKCLAQICADGVEDVGSDSTAGEDAGVPPWTSSRLPKSPSGAGCGRHQGSRMASTRAHTRVCTQSCAFVRITSLLRPGPRAIRLHGQESSPSVPDMLRSGPPAPRHFPSSTRALPPCHAYPSR